jgi:DMSO/TMAO reductase YedYZ heme-binding membrane subunit
MAVRPYFKSVTDLPKNSRFWVLCAGITASFFIAGIIQLYVPAGNAQLVKIEQAFAFSSLLFLYLALLVSPLLKVFPRIRYKEVLSYNRRPIGVLAFYFAFLHAYLVFFNQLGGFAGITYYNTKYEISLFFGILGLAILAVLAFTSFDALIKKITFRRWKVLQRLVYIAGCAILVHIIILGPDFTKLTIIGLITYIALLVLLILQIARIRIVILARRLK